MAVINCPSCNKKVSDKAKTCSHCNIPINALDQEQLHAIEAEQRIKKKQTLMNHSFIAMLLFCGGFLFLFWQNAQPGSWQYYSSMASTVLGFILYLITRVRLVLLKRKK